MARKRYYVTIEIEADVDKKRTMDEQSQSVREFIYNGLSQKKLDYGFYIQNDNVLSIIDEKGQAL